MIEPLCKGRRCLVVGSAPGVALPEPVAGELVMGANGGAAIARDAGRTVDVLLTTAHLFRATPSPVEAATIESLRGLEFRSVWVDTRNGPGLRAAWGLNAIGSRGDRLVQVSPGDRSSVVLGAIGADIWVSTGVWAACLAMVSGALEVELAGVSLARGHEGMPDDTAPRDHVVEDAQALYLLVERGVRVPANLREAVR